MTQSRHKNKLGHNIYKQRENFFSYFLSLSFSLSHFLSVCLPSTSSPYHCLKKKQGGRKTKRQLFTDNLLWAIHTIFYITLTLKSNYLILYAVWISHPFYIKIKFRGSEFKQYIWGHLGWKWQKLGLHPYIYDYKSIVLPIDLSFSIRQTFVLVSTLEL